MSVETFYPEPSMLDDEMSHSLLLNNSYDQDFLSLSLLEKENDQEMMPPMSFECLNQQGPMQAVDTTQEEVKPRRTRQLRPAPRHNRKRSSEADMAQVPPLLHTYPSISSGSLSSYPTSSSHSHSNSQDHGDFTFNHSPTSPTSDLSSPKSSMMGSWHPDDVQKREKHLERNRAAASKSRQKKKRETDQLKNRYQDVSRRRKYLEEQIKALHSNLLFLKDQILMHSRCDDSAIHRYLGQMVKHAARNESVSNGDVEDDLVMGSVSPRDTQGMTIQPHQIPLHMDDAVAGSGLPCSIEKPMMDEMMPPPNIFDYQISI
ncbi:hypothetical protein BJX99DRAFT_9153 [Aspergillus californicus]